jgi:hypothetical protein
MVPCDADVAAYDSSRVPHTDWRHHGSRRIHVVAPDWPVFECLGLEGSESAWIPPISYVKYLLRIDIDTGGKYEFQLLF